MTKNNIEFGAACLGFAGMAATWWRMKPSENQMTKGWRQQPQITVFAAECTDENGHTPASSMNVSGTEALRALRCHRRGAEVRRRRRAAMTPTETVAILRQFNAWRRGDEDIPQPDPCEIGEAIDAAVEMIERAESDLATAEQDSRQKQARIECLETALKAIARMQVIGVLKHPSLPIKTALAALEESK